MRRVTQYFEIIYSIIERCGAINDDVQYLQFSQIEGIVNGILYFAVGKDSSSFLFDQTFSFPLNKGGQGVVRKRKSLDGSRLVFTERIFIRNYRSFKARYSYQYLRDDETILRYDNAPHHLHLPTFPHHKHEGDTIIASSEPTLQQVLAEIASLMD